jgi:mycofactocin system glycosyltransferase
MTVFRLDPTTRLIAGSDLLIGGSPLRLFRLSAAGRRRFDSLAAGDETDRRGSLVGRLVESGAVHPVPSADVERIAHTTVIIPTHSPDQRRLQALISTCRGTAAVVVVDDASPSPVPDLEGATVIRHEINRGPGASRNTGAEQATTPYLAFLDDDVITADAAWLASLLGHFDDEAVGAVAPRVRSRPGSGGRDAFERKHSPLDLGSVPGVVGPGRRVGYVPAAALVVRRDSFRDAGGFDADLRVGEDVDFVWRLVRAGRRCRYEPAVEVEHEPRPSWRAWAGQRFAYGTSAAMLASRHDGAVAPVRTTAWSMAIWALVSFKRPVAAAALAAFTTVALYRKVPGLGIRQSIGLTCVGHAYAGRSLAGAVRRVWWPLVAVGALRSRWCRRMLAASIVTAVTEWGAAPADLGRGLADDACYGTGVWAGVVAERQFGPLVPLLRRWPGSDTDR